MLTGVLRAGVVCALTLSLATLSLASAWGWSAPASGYLVLHMRGGGIILRVDSGEAFPLASTDGVLTQPTCSPDGSQMAYLTDSTLRVRDAAGERYHFPYYEALAGLGVRGGSYSIQVANDGTVGVWVLGSDRSETRLINGLLLIRAGGSQFLDLRQTDSEWGRAFILPEGDRVAIVDTAQWILTRDTGEVLLRHVLHRRTQLLDAPIWLPGSVIVVDLLASPRRRAPVLEFVDLERFVHLETRVSLPGAPFNVSPDVRRLVYSIATLGSSGLINYGVYVSDFGKPAELVYMPPAGQGVIGVCFLNFFPTDLINEAA